MGAVGWLLVSLGIVVAVRLLIGEPVAWLDFDIEDEAGKPGAE